MDETPFQPYIIDLPLRPDRRFLMTTKQAHDWYNPLEETQANELKWLQKCVDFGPGRKFLDAGCHHGYYTLTLANGCEVMGVDVHLPNLAVFEAEICLNRMDGISLFHGGIAHQTGWGYYNGKALGSLWDKGVKIQLITPHELYPEANVVKFDIEGAEYLVLPACIDMMPKVDTWIVELHLTEIEGKVLDPQPIIDLFKQRNYKACWWDRAYTASPAEACENVKLHRQSTFLFQK